MRECNNSCNKCSCLLNCHWIETDMALIQNYILTVITAKVKCKQRLLHIWMQNMTWLLLVTLETRESDAVIVQEGTASAMSSPLFQAWRPLADLCCLSNRRLNHREQIAWLDSIFCWSCQDFIRWKASVVKLLRASLTVCLTLLPFHFVGMGSRLLLSKAYLKRFSN